MMPAHRVLLFLVSGSFVGLAALACARRHSLSPGRWSLPAAIGLLATVTVFLTANDLTGYEHHVLTDGTVVSLLASAYGLLHLRHSYLAVPAPIRIGAACVLGALAALAVAARLPAGERPVYDATQFAVVTAVFLGWTVVAGESAIRFWVESRGRPAVQRARVRAIAAGYVSIVAIMVIFAASVAAHSRTGTTTVVRIACLAIVPFLYVSFLPPRWLQRFWRRPEEDALLRATDLVAFSHDRSEIAGRALDWALRLVGGAGGSITDASGALLAERGGGSGHGSITLPLGPHGSLTIQPGPFSPLFGSDEVARLEAYASTAAVALERVELMERLAFETARSRVTLQAISDLGEGVVIAEGTRIVEANEAIQRILGYAHEDLQTMSDVFSLVDPDERERLVDYQRRRVSGEDVPRQYETVFVQRGGRAVNVEVAVEALPSGDGPQRFLVIARHVTERTRAERDALRSRERIVEIYESVSDAFYALDHDWRIVYMNPVAERMRTSRPLEEVIGSNLWEMLPDLAATRFYDEFHRAVRDRVVVSFEEYYDRMDRWFDTTAYPTEEGLSVYYRDITDRKKSEEEYRRSQELFRSAFEHAAVGMAVIDTDGRYVRVNDGLCRLLGRSADELLATDSMALTHPDDRPQGRRIRRDLMAGDQTSVRLEKRFVLPDGSALWTDVAVSVVRDSAGRPVQFLSQVQDISERKRSEEALREAVKRLEALDQMKNAFLTAVSHELRTPLTSVLGFAHTLQSSVTLDDARRDDLLRRLRSNAERLMRLLSDLLDLDRLGRGLLEPNRRTVNVGELVRRVVEESEVLSRRRIELDVEDTSADLDAPKVERIVENLLVNAVKHTPDGTQVWLRVRSTPDEVTIVVEDAGPGVPSDRRRMVLEPFEQGPGIPGHSPGVGIGLALVQRFAELHGGRVSVEERPGGGARFVVTLPRVVSSEDGPGGLWIGRADRAMLGRCSKRSGSLPSPS